MNSVAIILAAGKGERLGLAFPKQYIMINEKPVLEYSLDIFQSMPDITGIVLVVDKTWEENKHLIDIKRFSKIVAVIRGGERRQDSVFKGLKAVPEDTEIVLIHDSARAFAPAEAIRKGIEEASKTGAAILSVPVSDTIKVAKDGQVVSTPDRERLFIAQTPQIFKFSIYKELMPHLTGFDVYTDDAMLFEKHGNPVTMVDGGYDNMKITSSADIFMAEKLVSSKENLNNNEAYHNEITMRIGTGYDIHKLVKNRKLILGGVEIDYNKGLLGHSDADVLVHAIIDAILGAMGAGDIGGLFPDNDKRYKGISSMKLLEKVMEKVEKKKLIIVNIDSNIIVQEPKMMPYIDLMINNIKDIVGRNVCVSVKARSNEGLESVGKSEAIIAQAVVLLTNEV